MATFQKLAEQGLQGDDDLATPNSARAKGRDATQYLKDTMEKKGKRLPTEDDPTVLQRQQERT